MKLIERVREREIGRVEKREKERGRVGKGRKVRKYNWEENM